MSINEEFIDEISQVSPSNNVTDETLNTPIAELQHNIKFLANLISSYGNIGGAKYGNLLNYGSDGSLVSQNGGTFNSFETKNSWTAIENNVVANDTKINSDIPLDLLVWTGISSTQESGGTSLSWIEREIFIPPELRGLDLTFAIKGTGVNFIPTDAQASGFTNGEIPYCDKSTTYGIPEVGTTICLPTSVTTTSSPSTATSGTSGTVDCNQDQANKCFARYEDVIVEVVGATVATPFVITLGPWANHQYFSKHDDWKPQYRTKVINFKTTTSTTSIKIKIYRTRADGAIAFSNMFVGSIPRPYTDWTFNDIDINELYDFGSGLVKLHSSELLGHHLASTKSSIKLSNILTAQHMIYLQQFNKEIPEFDWDQITGPRHIELDNENEDTPKVSVFEFDSDFDRYMHFNIKADGPSPGMSYLGMSYFTTFNTFSEGSSADCLLTTDSICNPPISGAMTITLSSLPELGTLGTVDSSGNPVTDCVKKEFIDNRYVYTYFLTSLVLGQTIKFVIGGYSTSNPSTIDPAYLEEYRNKWRIDYIEENEPTNPTNTVCLMYPNTKIGYMYNESVKVNLVMPRMPPNETSLAEDNPCGNVKFNVYTKVVNPGENGNPSFADYTKHEYTIYIPKKVVDDRTLGYFELYGDFFNGLNANRGAIIYFILEREGSSETDSFTGNLCIASTKIGVADPPDDIPATKDYNLVEVDC